MSSKSSDLTMLSPLPKGIVVALSSDLAKSASEKIWHLPAKLKEAHPNRQRDWFSSRLALLQAFEHFGVKIDPHATLFAGPQQITQHPDYRFSISHTSDTAACWLIHDPERNYKIGFDIEEPKRAISQEVAQRIHSKSDIALTPLELWSAKEAVFKSVAPELQTDLVFSKIALRAHDFYIEALSLGGRYEVVTGELVCSFAWSRT